jgi:glyoxylase-like metal-dependent hydrolase (beta-lactamase superfamily II)
VFLDERRRILIGGDHLLAHISSNALASRPLGDGADFSHPLLTYMDSMRATRELAAELVLPGHGDPITDHRALIDERLRMHERRARKLLRLLSGGPLSAYELALEMWGNVAVTQAFLTISEVLGHMDLLVRDGLAGEIEDDRVIRFQALSQG